MITGYIINKETGEIESYYELKEQPKNTDKHEFVQCPKENLPEIEPKELTEKEQLEMKVQAEMRNQAINSLQSRGEITKEQADSLRAKNDTQDNR